MRMGWAPIFCLGEESVGRRVGLSVGMAVRPLWLCRSVVVSVLVSSSVSASARMKPHPLTGFRLAQMLWSAGRGCSPVLFLRGRLPEWHAFWGVRYSLFWRGRWIVYCRRYASFRSVQGVRLVLNRYVFRMGASAMVWCRALGFNLRSRQANRSLVTCWHRVFGARAFRTASRPQIGPVSILRFSLRVAMELLVASGRPPLPVRVGPRLPGRMLSIRGPHRVCIEQSRSRIVRRVMHHV